MSTTPRGVEKEEGTGEQVSRTEQSGTCEPLDPRVVPNEPASATINSHLVARIETSATTVPLEQQVVQPRGVPNEPASALSALEWIRRDEHMEQSQPCLTFEQNYGQAEYCRHCDWTKQSHEWWQHWLTIQRAVNSHASLLAALKAVLRTSHGLDISVVRMGWDAVDRAEKGGL